jgi:DNA primase
MFNLDRYVKESFSDVQTSGDERIVRCIYCGKKGKLYINVVKRKLYCFRCGAGQGATLTSFIRDHRGVTEQEAWQILRSGDYDGLPTRDYEAYYAKQIHQPRATILPTEYLPLYPLDSGAVLGERAVAKLRARGLTDADFLFYRIGYCLSGRYRHRIIVPVSRDREIVYFVARLFWGWGKRYLNPTHDEISAEPSTLLFNWDHARESTTLKLGEGVFDAIGLGEDATGMLGKQLHDGQLRLLETGKFERAEIWLDSRAKDPMADQDSDKIAFQLQVFNVPITICRLQSGDPGDLRVHRIPVTRYTGSSWAAHYQRRYAQTEESHDSQVDPTRQTPAS